jgi:hypothetical protein
MDQKSLKVQRILQEIRWLSERSNIIAEYVDEGIGYVLYYSIETSGTNNLPKTTDVLVPVPNGYPAQQIDMPALPVDSPLVPRVVGGANPQSTVVVKGRTWVILSYHPYANGGGPPWNPTMHGFHDYYNHIFTWLHRLNNL